MIFHAFLIRPEGTEATRGYLHGGLFIDFIGQTPVSVFRLLSFDLLILLVDFVMLGLIIERVKTAGLTTPPTTNTNPTNSNTEGDTQTDAQTQENEQDHDAEERGVVRGNEDDTSTPPVVTIDQDDVNDERLSLLADPGDNLLVGIITLSTLLHRAWLSFWIWGSSAQYGINGRIRLHRNARQGTRHLLRLRVFYGSGLGCRLGLMGVLYV